jgi:zinc transporter ZupT
MGMLAGIGIVGTEISRLPESSSMSLDSKTSEILALTIAASIVLLGPGAFSLDARLFGHREIIIPPSSRSPKT